jgi:hypothetical protein
MHPHTITNLMQMDQALSEETRVLSVLPEFAHGLVRGHYPLHQYSHGSDHKLIASKYLPCWVFVYSSNVKNTPMGLQTLATFVASRNFTGVVPTHRAVVGAVRLEEHSVSQVRARFPTIPLLTNTSQTLIVIDRVCFEKPVVDIEFSTDRHDAWVNLTRPTMRRLLNLGLQVDESDVPLNSSNVSCTIELSGCNSLTAAVDIDGRVMCSAKKLASLLECPASGVTMEWTCGGDLPRKGGYFYVPDADHASHYDLEAFGACGPGYSSATSASHDSAYEEEKDAVTVYEDPNMQDRYMFLLKGVWPKKRDKYWRRDTKKFYLIGEDGDLLVKKQHKKEYLSVARRLLAYINPTRIVVPTKDAMKALIEVRHTRGHDGRERMGYELGNHYAYKGLRALLIACIKDCARCQEFSQRYPKLIQAIITSLPLELVMFDLTKLACLSLEGYTYLLTVVDHFTKYKWAFGLRSKQMEPVVAALYTLFKNSQVPARWHCDNGKEFVNACMTEVLERLGGLHLTHGRPRHPATQGMLALTYLYVANIVHILTVGMHIKYACAPYTLCYF